MDELLIVPLHKHPQYLLQCCSLINSEWPRSETARLRSLESSCDFLPVNLILLKSKTVIGHLKLSKIPSLNESCFVESVVIDIKLRGLGFGTKLMKEAEKYCQNNLHLKSIYLSTKGQEKFYEKLGYKVCEPICIYGGSFFNIIPLNNNNYVSKNINKTAPVPLPMPKINLPQTKNQKTYMCKTI